MRSLIDCQIAALALRLDAPVAHRDHDYEVIAAHCGLRTVPLYCALSPPPELGPPGRRPDNISR